MQTVSSTYLAQYANSPRLCNLIETFNAAADTSTLLDLFITHVWNPLTATGWGLDIWGRIVGVSRILKITNTGYWGFSQGAPTSQSFGQGIWFHGGAPTSNHTLSDDDFRRLIFTKAAANISGGSIAALNTILMQLFAGRGRCFVADNQDMSLTYVFNFPPTPIDISLIASGVLPRPSGVQYHYTFMPDTLNDFGNDIL